MENELNFRTAVGGYRKDEVMEYVENINDEMFRMKKSNEEEAEKSRLRIQELETRLQEKEEESEEQKHRIQNLEEEMAATKEELEKTGNALKETQEANSRLKEEKLLLKEKLAKEVLRLRAENKVLRENWKDAENRAGCKDDYEAVKKAIAEAQTKITEYVDIINKTQESLGETYQRMNQIKKKVAEEIEKATKK